MKKNRYRYRHIWFWFVRVWFPLILLIGLPTFISLQVSGNLSRAEVQRIANTNPLTRAIYETFSGNTVGIIVILWGISFVAIWIIIRKISEKRVFNDGKFIKLDWCFRQLWVANKIIGFKKITMLGVSLPLQFKIYSEGVFEEKIIENSDSVMESFAGNINVDISKVGQGDELNLLICDTYDILDRQIAEKYKSNPAVKIHPEGGFKANKRYDNAKLSAEVRKIVLQYCEVYSTVNLFLTTNPLNTKRIVDSSFSANDRTGFEAVFVVQMGDNRIYDKRYRIY